MANFLSKEEVDVLMKAVSGGEVPLPKAGLKTKQKKPEPTNVKEYDFRYPVMFLADQLRTLEMIHEAFARTFANALATYLRSTVHVRCISASQFAYRDFVRSLPEHCILAKMRFRPSEGRVLMAISPSVGSGFVDRVMGGPGGFYENATTGQSNNTADPDERPAHQPFTEIEQFVIDDVMELTLKELEPAWNA